MDHGCMNLLNLLLAFKKEDLHRAIPFVYMSMKKKYGAGEERCAMCCCFVDKVFLDHSEGASGLLRKFVRFGLWVAVLIE